VAEASDKITIYKVPAPSASSRISEQRAFAAGAIGAADDLDDMISQIHQFMAFRAAQAADSAEANPLKPRHPRIICNYCKKPGHTEDVCFQKHGRPADKGDSTHIKP
jgi:hypothetical protein